MVTLGDPTVVKAWFRFKVRVDGAGKFVILTKPTQYPCKITKRRPVISIEHDWSGDLRAYNRDHPDYPDHADSKTTNCHVKH